MRTRRSIIPRRRIGTGVTAQPLQRSSSTASTWRTITIIGAFIAAPVMMFLGYNSFGAVAASNFHIHDLAEDYSEGVAVALLLLMLIQFWPIPAEHRRALTLLWLIRMGVALGMMIAFEAIYYGGDATRFFLHGKSLNQPLDAIEFGAGTANIMAIVGLLAKVTGSYTVIKVLFTHVGLIAAYIFYRAAVICLGREKIALLYILGILPSLLFWSSQLGKDPIVLLGIAIYCYGVAGLIVQQRFSMILWIAVGLAIASFIRIWLGLIFVTPVVFTFIMASRTSPLAKMAFLVIGVPAFLFAMNLFAARFRIASAEELIATTDALSQSWMRGGSAQAIGGGFDSLQSMITFIPIGAFTALFRPLPLEVPNIFGILAGLENAVLLLLILLGLFRRGVGWLGQPILLWAAATLFIWAAIYGFVSYQNLGTAFRFRVQVVPILLLLGLYLSFAHHLLPASGPRAVRAPPPSGPPSGERSAGADARG